MTDILDHGFVRLIDFMGEDATVAMDARGSRGHFGERRPWEVDERLTRTMQRMEHTTPFEMIETKWLCKMPIFVAREWVRYRTASITEFSMRYADPAEISDSGVPEFYVPARWRAQATTNKQSSVDSDDLDHATLTSTYRDQCLAAVDEYNYLVANGAAREMARMVLPVSMYTEWVWKIDLHNLLHMLHQRTAPDAQWEFQQYANAMIPLLRECIPNLMKVVWPEVAA